MRPSWRILYRGPLSSCNYSCDYCPFAKTRNTAAELKDDFIRLGRFIDWVDSQAPQKIGILFTPWGEALIHAVYQKSMVRLSHLPHVYRATIQTNLSCKMDWVEDLNANVASLWCTWHPTQISRERFISRCRELDAASIRYSVGVVGLKEAITDIEALRAELAPEVYLWVNAYKRKENYYTKEEIKVIESIDPLFSLNNQYHLSLGKQCDAGETAFTVDGNGDARRCHFIKKPIGNIYKPDFVQTLRPRACVNEHCGCYIGYTNLKELSLIDTYGSGLLDRIPSAQFWNSRST
ncbi:STM4011 family radical SAM protein [Cerasicoccus arenae]|uniref:Radical SAM protein n=1 Tax=Cerasicoccus arenae TaxID=424488 RepID=A0A8J3DGB4_9BACT|nr:STM4011 family radical SAM protein [Cerasicoccus arenae]MBK1859704.1 STM4011 family radical SAM protein [Cerasicoccus arenae]GHC03724.1 hypothetical protein GCM10007047_20470 [Cerasicoccus arenae]